MPRRKEGENSDCGFQIADFGFMAKLANGAATRGVVNQRK